MVAISCLLFVKTFIYSGRLLLKESDRQFMELSVPKDLVDAQLIYKLDYRVQQLFSDDIIDWKKILLVYNVVIGIRFTILVTLVCRHKFNQPIIGKRRTPKL